MSSFVWLDVVDESGGSIVDATSSQKGVVKLTQDLGGSADLPTVAKIHGAAVPVAGSLTIGQALVVSGSSALSYGPVDLANVSAVTGLLPATNQTAQSLAGDLSGTTATATVISLTGAAGIVTTSAAIEHTGLENNSATVLMGELIRAKKTVSLVHGGTGNFDSTIWQTPTRFRLIACIVRFASSVTLGALGAAVLTLGTSAGGTELIAAYTVLGTETTSTAPVGALTAQLGTDLASAGNFQKMYLTAQTISLRTAISAGSITAGSVEVELVGYQF